VWVTTLILVLMKWPQPLIQACYMATDGAYQRCSSTYQMIGEFMTDMAWTAWTRILRLIIIIIHHAFYDDTANNNRTYRKKAMSADLLQYLWRKLETAASRIGNWMESSLKPTTPRMARTKVRTALWAHRRRTTALAMSVLAMQARSAVATERSAHFDTDSSLIGVDNRCSGCISHIKEDFIGALKPSHRVVKGFGGSRTTNVHTGTLRWSWEDDSGRKFTFDIPDSYYIPEGKVRLLSPQHWAQSQSSKNRTRKSPCGERTDANECVLYWNHGHSTLHIPLGKRDNVATFSLAQGYSQFAAFCCEIDGADLCRHPMALPSGIISDDDADDVHDEVPVSTPLPWQHLWQRPSEVDKTEPSQTEFNLQGPPTPNSEGESSTPNVILDEESRQPKEEMAELLMLHHQYGHVPMRKLQTMAEQGILPRRLAKCRTPICTACLYAKATRRPWRGKTRKNHIDEGIPTRPGQIVSVDQLVSPTPGLIAQITGFLTTKRYKYATVYVDQFSRIGYVYLQKTASAEETVEGKKAFERYAKRHGITVENYHADNGIFKARLWTDTCAKDGQGLTFAGVNAHHQNGVAERRIKELQEMARSMLIHASSRWPDSVTANLWPYAIRVANEAINNTPSLQDKGRRSPTEIFTKTKVVSNPKHWKPFGCPVYVLDNSLQGQQPFHKWKSRSKVGVYIGTSPHHSRNVALVLDRGTALVSPQFHVAFDAAFETVKDIKMKSNWQNKAGFVAQKEALSTKTKGLDNGTTQMQETSKTTATERIANSEGASTAGSKKRKRQEKASKNQAVSPESQQQSEPAAANENRSVPRTSHDGGGSRHSEVVDRNTVTVTRSGRKTKPIHRLTIEAMMAELSPLTANDVEGELFCYAAMFPDDDRDHDDPLLAHKAVSDPDTLYFHEAMREKDRDKFLEGMSKELADQFDNGNFTVIPKSEVPKDEIILPAVWQLKRKRDAKTGTVKKYKARLNIDGSRMRQGIHYNETYSPVASWNSVRMLLTLTAVHGWHTKQIDFVQAFAQAPVEKTLYMKVPAGVELEDGNDPRDHVLRIHRNIYGQKQAGRVWNKFLVNKLVNGLGFRQSKVDECVFYRGKTLYVLYTDDSLLAGPDKEEIDKVIEDLKTKAKLAITVEGDLADFLGVNIERKGDGTIHLTQPHLIGQILEDLRMNDESVKPRSTPAASSKILTRHSSSRAFDNSFNYRSIVGKLNYLEKATRSDISFAVHQCARFVSDPKREHGEAIRWLGRYLKGTRYKGTILRPIKGKDLEVFVDASFCGDWDPVEAATDRDTARSRHGYIVNYAGCPLLWKSQLQTEIALSTTESEYTGLSYALRDAIPIIELLKEMKMRGYPISTAQAKVHCRVFEDNSGALEMAKVHKYRPRTKHLNIRLHHFRDYVERHEISIHAIATEDQPADYLTKALNETQLAKHRQTVMGW
jgi:hypothetical protein